jgi:hypothetical protein
MQSLRRTVAAQLWLSPESPSQSGSPLGFAVSSSSRAPGEFGSDVRQYNCFVNELCAAVAILNGAPIEALLSYEPPLQKSQKTIDFLLVLPGFPRQWVDVKTVDPEWRDDQKAEERRERALKHVPPNVSLVVDAASYHHMSATRARFLEYTLQFEEKIRLLSDAERGVYQLIFCGNGFSWRRDALEDFADFYLSGHHRSDDGLRDMESHVLKERGVAIDRSISGFCLLMRAYEDDGIRDFRCGVRGPVFDK